MASLFQRIKELYPDVAKALERERFLSDDDIRSLTLEDLLPGPHTLRQRKDVYELQQQKPIGELLKALKAFIPAESLTAALTENSVLIDYLRTMKDMATQVEKIHTFFLEHVSLLEEHRKDYQAGKGTHTGSDTQPGSNVTPRPTGTQTESNVQQGSITKGTHTGSDTRPGSNVTPRPTDSIATHTESNVQQGSKTTGTSWNLGYVLSIPFSNPFTQREKQHVSPGTGVDIQASRPAIDPAPHPSDAKSPTAHDAQCISEAPSSVAPRQISVTENPPSVRFRSFVSGNTLDCEKTLLDRVSRQATVTLVEDDSDPQIIILFCPIVSRIDSDLANVMAKPPASLGDKPVILVMMYHTHEPNEGLIQRPGLFLKQRNVVLNVNVFYYDGMHGLLSCEANTKAVADIGTALLEHSACKSNSASGKSEVHRRDGSASDSFTRERSEDISDVGVGGCDRNACPGGYGDHQCPRGSSRVKASHDDQRGSVVHHVDLAGGDDQHNRSACFNQDGAEGRRPSDSPTGSNNQEGGTVRPSSFSRVMPRKSRHFW